jgi:hypothetical protein
MNPEIKNELNHQLNVNYVQKLRQDIDNFSNFISNVSIEAIALSLTPSQHLTEGTKIYIKLRIKSAKQIYELLSQTVDSLTEISNLTPISLELDEYIVYLNEVKEKMQKVPQIFDEALNLLLSE